MAAFLSFSLIATCSSIGQNRRSVPENGRKHHFPGAKTSWSQEKG